MHLFQEGKHKSFKNHVCGLQMQLWIGGHWGMQ
jgi:hypothetical protein